MSQIDEIRREINIFDRPSAENSKWMFDQITKMQAVVDLLREIDEFSMKARFDYELSEAFKGNDGFHVKIQEALSQLDEEDKWQQEDQKMK